MAKELGMGVVEATKKSDTFEYANDHYMNFDKFFEPIVASQDLYDDDIYYDFF